MIHAKYSVSKDKILIDCDRILLRTYAEADLDAIYQITLQPEIAEFLPDWVATREQRALWLTKYEIPENQTFLDSMPQIGNNIARFAILLKETNELIGWIITGMKEGVPTPNREIGYAISNEHTGKGYAAEAAAALLQFLFEKTDVDELVAVARTYNAPSNRVLQKIGYRFVDVLTLEGKENNYYRIRKP